MHFRNLALTMLVMFALGGTQSMGTWWKSQATHRIHHMRRAHHLKRDTTTFHSDAAPKPQEMAQRWKAIQTLAKKIAAEHQTLATITQTYPNMPYDDWGLTNQVTYRQTWSTLQGDTRDVNQMIDEYNYRMFRWASRMAEEFPWTYRRQHLPRILPNLRPSRWPPPWFNGRSIRRSA